MHLKISAAVLLVAALVGCDFTEHFTRAYENSVLRVKKGANQKGYVEGIDPGQNVVLEYHHYSSVFPSPGPDAGVSWLEFHIELRPNPITKGNVIEIPSDGARAYVAQLFAPHLSSSEATGTVRIVEIRDAGISVQIDLAAKDKFWAQSRTDTYRYARHSCIGKVDSACEFYAK